MPRSPRSVALPPPPDTPFQDDPSMPLHVTATHVWSPLSRGWRAATPEEMVRQRFVYELHTKYGYSLDQMAQEVRMARGRSSSRADIVVARDAEALGQNRDYVLAVELKADTVPLMPSDYWQGESYARVAGCEFLVMHNERETRCVRLIPGAPGERVEVERIPAANDWSDESKLDSIRGATQTFTRDAFRKLLSDCHSILRDNHKMEPGAAFDEISKILFIKMGFERTGDRSRFTQDYLKEYERVRRSRGDELMKDLFEEAKTIYRADDLFGADDGLKVSLPTFKRIVQQLEGFDLSATSDDVKGIAFESFLGQTFRGDLGQFFTPRPIVEFMVEMMDPGEDDIVCDPASGTGGFLIRIFEYIREKIVADVEAKKAQAREDLEQRAATEDWDPDRLAEAIEQTYADLNKDLDPEHPTGRMYQLSRDQIFGTDAEARAARVSKMNMIMHGDGHGGLYYHDGLLDIGGVLPGRSSMVLTNPPFGSNVGQDQVVGATEQTRVTTDSDLIRSYEAAYGDEWRTSHDALQVAARDRRPILGMYDIGLDPIGGSPDTATVRTSRTTESLFVERSIDLLRPGGQLGIVLPEGILNNPSLQWLRDYVEGRARLQAVVSVPHEVFASSKATVKTSLVFLQRFTEEDEEEWARALADGRRAADERYAAHAQQREDAMLSEVSSTAGEPGLEFMDQMRQRSDLDRRKRELAATKAVARRRLAPAERDAVKRIEREAAKKRHTEDAVERANRLTAEAHAVSEFAGEMFEAGQQLRDLDAVAARADERLEEARAGLAEPEMGDHIESLVRAYERGVTDQQATATDLALDQARELFEYPVFMAEVQAAGITATGETGSHVANELPAVVEAYRAFQQSQEVEFGVIEEQTA